MEDVAERQVVDAPVLIAAILTGCMYIVSAVFPSAMNWGFHQFAFIPRPLAITLGVLFVLMLVPRIQDAVAGMLRLSAQKFNALPSLIRHMLISMALIMSGVVFWVMRERAYLLGDGNLVIRVIRTVAKSSDLPAVFSTEPLAGLLFWRMRQFLDLFGIGHADEFPIQLVNLLFSIGSVVLMWRIVRELVPAGEKRLLSYLILIGTGTTQLFFAYVEVYPPLFCCYLLLMLLMIRRNGRPLHLLSAVYGILVAFHFGMISLFPVMLLVWHEGRKRVGTASTLLSVGISAGVALILLWICGFNGETLASNVAGRARHILPLASADDYWASYGLLSPYHALDIANLLILVWPATLAVLVLLWRIDGFRTLQHDRTAFLLAVAAICGFSLVAVVNTELGMARDWDLLSTYAWTLPFAGFALLASQLQKNRVSMRTMVTIVAMSVIPAAGWISVNAAGESAAESCSALLDRRMMGRHAYLTALEEMAVHFRWENGLDKSAAYYEKFLALDSLRTRIWLSYAYLYELNHDEVGEAAVLERALRQGAVNVEIVETLSGIYYRNNRPDDARRVLAAGVASLPRSAEMQQSYGIFLVNALGDYQRALVYLRNALDLDSTSADAWYNAGLCSYRLGDSSAMQRYFKRFLQLEPASEDANHVRLLLSGSGKDVH